MRTAPPAEPWPQPDRWHQTGSIRWFAEHVLVDPEGKTTVRAHADDGRVVTVHMWSPNPSPDDVGPIVVAALRRMPVLSPRSI